MIEGGYRRRRAERAGRYVSDRRANPLGGWGLLQARRPVAIL